jgi:hypothetical protein
LWVGGWREEGWLGGWGTEGWICWGAVGGGREGWILDVAGGWEVGRQ